MAETTIMNVAGDFSVDRYTQPKWICRDDNNDYWTVVRDTTGNLRVYKSIDDGATWLLKKTLTNSDWINGNPLPTNSFQILNLSGIDKVYLRVVGATERYKNYGWIFNVTADTNEKDMDAAKLAVSYGDIDALGFIAWDAFNSRLVITGKQGSPSALEMYGEVDLIGGLIVSGGDTQSLMLDYYISPQDGYGWEGYINGYTINTNKKSNGADFHDNIQAMGYTWLQNGGFHFCNFMTDSDGNPIIGVVYKDDSDYYVAFARLNKTTGAIIEATNPGYVIGTTIPDICTMTVDGNNNVYFIYTDGVDGEAYSIKWDGSWTKTKISSDNDGQLAAPEIRVPATSNILLLTYQATA